MKRLRIAATALLTAGALAFTPAVSASARPASYGHSSLGTTKVTTAPGIAVTLLKAGIAPLPQLPRTGFGVSFTRGLQVTYGFPITGSTADLAKGTGDITHAGGITFVSRKAQLAIGNFDIDLKAGKIFATKVNGAAARVPILDLDLSTLKVTTRNGDTVLSGIGLDLDPVAASVLNKTFGIALPTDGSLRFGSGQVTLKG